MNETVNQHQMTNRHCNRAWKSSDSLVKANRSIRKTSNSVFRRTTLEPLWPFLVTDRWFETSQWFQALSGRFHLFNRELLAAAECFCLTLRCRATCQGFSWR